MSVRRYQLACAILAATTAGALVLGHRPATSAPSAPVAARAAAGDRLRRPVRVDAASLGLSEAALIDRLLAATGAREVRLVIDKLAVVGTDDAVVALAPLADDPRSGVPEAAIAAIGAIGGARATEAIFALLDDARPRVRVAAVSALARLDGPRPLAALLAMSGDRRDPARLSAIAALGDRSEEAAVARLVALARSGDAAGSQAAIAALAGAPDAEARLLALLDAPELRVQLAALEVLEPSSPTAVARLAALVDGGDPRLVGSALGALGRAGDPAVVPILARTARGGGGQRWAAVSALGEVGGPEAVAALGALVRDCELDLVGHVASTLTNLGDPDARARLIAAAQLGGRRGAAVIANLAALHGPDVSDALLAIATGGDPTARREALPILVRAGRPEAVALAAALARTGGRGERLAAIGWLGETDEPQARQALLDLAERERGAVRSAALDALGQARPDDPALAAILGDALLAGRPDEVTAAAGALARLGTADAEALLVAAIEDDDPARAAAAIGAVGAAGAMSAEVRAALGRLAVAGPPGLRAHAAQQVLAAGGSDAVALARTLVTSGDAEVARQAVWSLSAAGVSDLGSILRDGAASRDPLVRGAVASALAQRDDPASTALLTDLGHDPSPEVRYQALQSLGSLGSRPAIDALVAATGTGELSERMTAIASLGSSEDPAASAAIARLIEDRDPDVASAAIWAASSGGNDVDDALLRVFRGSGHDDPRWLAAAQLLYQRGVSVDDATAAALTAAVGPLFGGAGYGGWYRGEE